jgi:excisionase family DNA binding protein
VKPERRLLDQLPGESLVPVHWVRELLSTEQTDNTDPLADLTAEQVAAALGRCASTIRSWCAAGQIEAYKLNNREWRIPREALRAYQDAQSPNKVDNGKGFRPGREYDLGSWRKLKAAKT